MDLWDALRVVVRRWYVMLPAFAILMGATFAIVSSLDSTYEATSSLTLLPPADEIDAEGERVRPSNPYATPENDFRILTALIAEAFNGNDVGFALAEEHGFDESYTYDVIRDDGSPILNIVVEASSPEAALDGAVAAREVLDQVLREQQVAAGVDDDDLIVSQTVSEARRALELTGSRVRVAMGLGAASLLLALAAAYVADGVLARRSPRSSGAWRDVPADDSEPPTAPKVTSSSRRSASAKAGTRPSARAKKRPGSPRPRS